MIPRYLRALRLSTLVLPAFVFSLAPPALAETPVQQNVDNRVVLAFHVSEAGLQGWLPTPWQVNPVPAGPSKDANLLISFIDRLINQDMDGKLIAGGTDRVVSIAVPARNSQTGETAPFAVREFYANVDGVPGPYKTAVPATIKRQATLQGTGLKPGTGGEVWEIRENGGAEGVIEVRFEYEGGVPSRVKSELRLRSPVDPSFFRIYRFDAGNDVVMSIPAGINRAQKYEFRTAGKEMRRLFDGAERIMSITVIPWYVRQVYLP
jgi:hypothetical protein